MSILERELVPVSTLKPHPRNYRAHPADQLEHLRQSLREHGFYRNILLAKDGTILAGHGMVMAAEAEGYTEVPAVRLPLKPDEPRALKVLAGDNELLHLAEVDDRALSEMLREVSAGDLNGLLGTGYDEAMLANLVYVTRPNSEVRDHNEAREWTGMPHYDTGEQDGLKLIVRFRDEADREAFGQAVGLRLTPETLSVWYPPKEREDLSSVKWTEEDG